MVSLQHDSTLVMKVLKDFEIEMSKSSRVSNDILAKRLTFDEPIIEKSSCSNNGNEFSSFDTKPYRKRCHVGELVSSKSKIIKLEDRIAELETENRQAKVDFDRQIEDLKAEKWRQKEAYEEMQLKCQQVMTRDVTLKKEYVECRKELRAKLMTYEDKLKTLENEKDDLCNELNEHVVHSSETIFSLENELQRLRMAKESLQKQTEALEEQLEGCSRRSVNIVSQMQAADEAKMKAAEAEHRIKELELDVSKHEDDRKLTKILQHQLSKLPELEKENRMLKEENRVHRMRDDNIMLLKEQLDSTKSTLERTEQLCAELPKYKLENEDLKQKLGEWDKFLSIVDLGERKSPQNVAKAISRLQQQETILVEKVGTLTSSNNALQFAKSNLEDDVQKLKDQLEKQEKLVKQNTDNIRHLQRKLLLVSKERDFCHELVEHYKKETTVLNVAQDEDRVQKLDSIMHGYQRVIESLEAELNKSRDQLTKFGQASCEDVQEERTKLEQEIKDLKSRLSTSEEKMRQLVEDKMSLELQLEYFTLKGEINPLKTRVVHLSSNPVMWQRQQRADELEKAKRENEVLRQRLNILEEAGGKVADLTIRVGEKVKEVPSGKEIEAMKEQLSSAELKNKRLLEAFRKISSDFHEVAYTLLGYKLEFPVYNQMKLSSMYAESADDYLLFEKVESGEVHLLETPFSTEIADKIDIYLHTYHSIPAFLSNLTLDLFNSQTALPSASSTEVTIS